MDSSSWQSNMAVLSDRAKLQDVPLGKQRSARRTGEEPSSPAVHVNASAVVGLPAPGGWLPPLAQLRDPRLPDAAAPPAHSQRRDPGPPRSSGPSVQAPLSPETAAGPARTPSPASTVTRTISDASMVSANSGRGSQYASAAESPTYSGSSRTWRNPDVFYEPADSGQGPGDPANDLLTMNT